MATEDVIIKILAQNTSGPALKDLSKSLEGISTLIKGLGIAVGVNELKAFAGEVLRTNIELTSIRQSLKFATGSAEEAARAFNFVREETKRLGLDLESAGSAFSKFAAASKGTALEGEGVRKVFTAVASAAAVLGLSAEDVAGVFRSLEQMMSKGVVAAEELRGQFSEKIPGGFKLAAEGMGKTTAEFNKLLDLGQVISEDMVPKLADAVQKAFGKDAEEAAKSTRAEIGRLKTEWTEFKDLLGETVVGPGARAGGGILATMLEGLAIDIRDARTAINAIREIIARGKEVELRAGLGKGLLATMLKALTIDIPDINAIREAFAIALGATKGQVALSRLPRPRISRPIPPSLLVGTELGEERLRQKARPTLTPAQIKAEAEFEESVLAGARADAEVLHREMEQVKQIRIDLLSLAGKEIKALELQRDEAVSLARTPELRLAQEELFAAKILLVRKKLTEESQKAVLAAEKAEKEVYERRRAVLDQQQEDEQEALENRAQQIDELKAIADELGIENFLKDLNLAEGDLRKVIEQFEKFREQNRAFEDEAQGQMAEIGEAPRKATADWSELLSSIIFGLGSLRGEFSGFGEFVQAVFSDMSRSISRTFLKDIMKDIKASLKGFIDFIAGIFGRRKLPAPSVLIPQLASVAAFLGQFVPGTGGRVLSGAGAGAMLGFQLGGQIGAIGSSLGAGIGAVAGGLLGGLFGGGKKRKDPIRQAIKDFAASQLFPGISELKALGFDPGALGELRSTAAIKAFGFLEGIPQRFLATMKKAAEEMKSIVSSALQAAFRSSDVFGALKSFNETLREGIAKFVQQGLIEAVLMSGTLTRLLAPLFQLVADAVNDAFAASVIGGGRGEPFNMERFREKFAAIFGTISAGLSSLDPFITELFNLFKNLSKQITGTEQGTLFGNAPPFIQALLGSAQRLDTGGVIIRPGLFNLAAREFVLPEGVLSRPSQINQSRQINVNAPIKIEAQISERVDIDNLGRDIGRAIERQLVRIRV